MSDKDQNGEPLPHELTEAKEEERRAAEREELLGARRARQAGQSSRKNNAKLLATLGFIAVAFFVFILSVGPGKVLGALGIGGTDQRASQIDMQVDRERDAKTQLDFLVPAIPEAPRQEEDPNAAFNEKFKALQDKLSEMERNRQPGLSSGEVQRMLSGYNDAMTKRLEEERRAMAEENARLRAEAEKAEEERRKAEEAAKLREDQYKLGREIEMKQRESKAVIVDNSASGQALETASEGGDMFPKDLDENERFLKASAAGGWQTSVSKRLSDPSRTVVQGSIISAVLETAIDTQLPGSIRAQVMRPVYSFDGSRVLMAPGTVLIGQFNNQVDLAQKRVLIAWNRAITPEGKSIALGSIGTDRLGRSGSLGNVDNRYGTKFGAAMLISAITAVPSILTEQLSKDSGSSGTTINIGGGSSGSSSRGSSSGGAGAQLADSIGGEVSDQASGILEKYLSLPPVIRIPQGEEIRVFVNRDLIFR